MNRKILALVLALVMCLSLAACGDKPAPGNSNEPSNPQSSSEPKNTTSQPENTPDNTEPQGGEEQTSGGNDEGTLSFDADADGILCLEGGVIEYPVDTWKRNTSGLYPCLLPIDSEGGSKSKPSITLSPYDGTLDEYIEKVKSFNAVDGDPEESITVNGLTAVKMIYEPMTDESTKIMLIAIHSDDMPEYSGNQSGYDIEVKVDKGSDDEALFEDSVVWEIINSFYYDKDIKYISTK